MESWLIQITNYLLAQSWQIAVLTIAVAIVSFLLRNRSAHVRYLLWLIVLAKCLIPPLYWIPVAVLPQQELHAYVPVSPIGERKIAEYRIPEAAVTESAGPAPVQSEVAASPKVTKRPVRYNTRAWLAVGWFVGVVVLLLYYLLNALRTQIWLQKQRKALPNESARNIESFFKAYGVKNTPRVWLLERISQPFVWGLVRGSIYLPSKLLDSRHAKFQGNLLGHELSHFVRLDAMVNSLQVVTQAVFWFHPFVWWANGKIRAEREKCCDEMTIARLNAPPEEYSEAIVETLADKYEQARPVPSLAVAGQIKNIEERIKTMLRPGKKFYKRPTVAVAIVALVIGLLTVPTALVLTARAQTRPTAEQDTSSAVKAAHIIWVSDAIDRQGDGRPDDQAWVDMLEARGYALDYSKGSPPLSSSPLKGYWRGLDDDKLAALNAADLIIVSRCTGSSSGYVKNGEREKWNSVKTPMILLNAFYARRSGGWRWLNTTGPTPELWPGRPPGASDVLTLSTLERRHPIFKNMGLDANNQVKIFDQTAGSGKVSFNPVANVGSGTLIATPAHQNWTFIAEWKPGSEFFPRAGQTPAGRRMLFAAGAIDGPGCGIGEYNLNEQGEKLFINMIEYMLGNVGRQSSAKATPTSRQKSESAKSLYRAAADGDLAQVKELLSSGLDVNAKDNLGETPLHRSARAGHKDVVEVLLSKGAEVDAGDASGLTPLYYASLHGCKDIVDLLLAKGADVNAQAQYCALTLPLLSFAILDGNQDAVRLLISKGANVNAKDNGDTTALFWAIWEKNKDIVELLINEGADINAQDNRGYTPMYMATYQDSKDLVELLTAKGATPQSTIHLAASAGDLARVKSLIEKGTDINARDKGGETPLFLAVLAKTDEVAEFLIAKGADIDARDNLGMTPLYYALEGGSKNMIELLISKGADVNATNKFGATPLHVASQRTKDVVELLITKGAQMNGRVTGGPWNGATPLHLVCITGFKDVAELLIAKGVDINVKDNNDKTPLHMACRVRRKNMVELLITKGADLNAKDNKGQTALSLAKEQEYQEIVELLEKHGAKE